MRTYRVPLTLVAQHDIKTGDRVTATIDNDRIMEIVSTEPNTFERAKSIRPNKNFQIGGTDFKLGSRVIIKTSRDFDFIEYMASGAISGDIYTIAFLIDESDDCTDYLRERGINEVYHAKVSFPLKKKVLCAISAMHAAKERAHQGKNVVLIVDNFNKLFHLYNSSMCEDASINISQIHVGSLIDLKAFLMEAKQADNESSFTIVGNIKDPSSDAEKYAMDEICLLSNSHLRP
jgi:hypothetical protein